MLAGISRAWKSFAIISLIGCSYLWILIVGRYSYAEEWIRFSAWLPNAVGYVIPAIGRIEDSFIQHYFALGWFLGVAGFVCSWKKVNRFTIRKINKFIRQKNAKRHNASLLIHFLFCCIFILLLFLPSENDYCISMAGIGYAVCGTDFLPIYTIEIYILLIGLFAESVAYFKNSYLKSVLIFGKRSMD